MRTNLVARLLTIGFMTIMSIPMKPQSLGAEFNKKQNMGINYSKEVEAIRNSLKRNPNDLENLTELVCGLCLLAEANLKDLGPSWPNTAIAEELIDKAKPLLSTKEGDEKLDAVIDRMAQ